jgi:glutamate--cysteine ligase
MDEHFRGTGTGGIHMMRGTASCQVALDYADEADFVAKYRCAYLLTPLLALLTDNSPRYEGRDYDQFLLRTDIWRRVDPARSGIVPTIFDPDFSFRKYAEYVLNQAAIFAVVDGVPHKTTQKAYEILAGRTEWDEDFLLYLSLVFPDVRLRQYIEIRVADAMPPHQTFAYLALIKGLFADIARLAEWVGNFPQSVAAIETAQNAIMADAWQAVVYGKPVRELCQQMIALAAGQLDDGERAILQNGLGGFL